MFDVDEIKNYLEQFINTDVCELEVYCTKQFKHDINPSVINLRLISEIKGKEVGAHVQLTYNNVMNYSNPHQILKFEVMNMVDQLGDCFLAKGAEVH